MFRKPKSKAASSQRKNVGRENVGGDEVDDESPIAVLSSTSEQIVVNEAKKHIVVDDDTEKASFSAKPQSIVSFDMDEGNDSVFEVKKNKKKVEELKRMHRLEEEAAVQEEERRKYEQQQKKELQQKIYREKKAREEKGKRNERQKYLDKYRDTTARHVGLSSYDEEEQADDFDDPSNVSNKFAGALGGIPDSRAVYEARKRRERARREGADGYIPLDDDKKLRSKGVRERLVREDENDDSDEDEPNNFYSSRALLKQEEDRRREEQSEFLAREQGDDVDENGEVRVVDDEMEEWERQQIRKAVSGRAIGQLRHEKMQASRIFGADVGILDENQEAMDMDIDMDVVVEHFKSKASGPSNTGGIITVDDILAKLKLRIQDREEALNSRRQEVKRIEETLTENRDMMKKIESELPNLSTRFSMYQELRMYSRSLLECLNEKVAEINAMADKKRTLNKSRMERLARRRRKDVRDQYAECTTAAAGKNANVVRQTDPTISIRAAEREARRGRRRRERETTLASFGHEEGLSTDDEETNSQMVADNHVNQEVTAQVMTLFADALDEYSNLKKVLERMIDWLAVDQKSFQDAYVHLCIPKLLSPFIRLQMISADIINNDVEMPGMPWYVDAMLAGSENTEIEKDHSIIVGLVPAIVEKVVVPFLTDVVRDEWEPLSLQQTKRLAAFCEVLPQFPTLTDRCKSFIAFMEAVRSKIAAAIEDDLFVPMFAPVAIDNSSTGCRTFLDRQYWTAVKLMRSINKLSPIISLAARFELVVEMIVNRVCVVALRIGTKNDASCEKKMRALMEELPEEVLAMGGTTSFRQIIATFTKLADEQKAAGRDFYRDIRKFVEKLQR